MSDINPSRIRITVDGQPAISIPLAGRRYGIADDTMRKTVARLETVGAVEATGEKLDARTDLYDLAQLDKAMDDRVGQGANRRRPKDPRPMAGITDEQQEAYEVAAAVLAPYPWAGDARERAAREIVTELWNRDDLFQIADSDHYRRAHTEGLVTSLRLQGALVTPIPIDRTVEAVAKLITEDPGRLMVSADGAE